MKVVADLCVIPIGEGISLSSHIRECQKILSRFKIKTHLHGYGTNLEGEWDEVFAAIRACHEELHASGVVRISSSLKFGTRTDKDASIQDKIDAAKTP